MAGELLAAEILFDAGAWLMYAIFKKNYNSDPLKEIYKKVYTGSVIFAIVDLLAIAATIGFKWY